MECRGPEYALCLAMHEISTSQQWLILPIIPIIRIILFLELYLCVQCTFSCEQPYHPSINGFVLVVFHCICCNSQPDHYRLSIGSSFRYSNCRNNRLDAQRTIIKLNYTIRIDASGYRWKFSQELHT